MEFIEARRLLFRYLKEHGAYAQFMRNTKKRSWINEMYVDISKAVPFEKNGKKWICDGHRNAYLKEYTPSGLLELAFGWTYSPEGVTFWSKHCSVLKAFFEKT